MREIKFRVWDKLTKRMHICGEDVHDTISFEIETNKAYYYNLQNGCGSLREDSDYVLMQYAGLKDKNGKEIYEGDIVLYQDWEQCYEGGGNDSFINKGIVEYNESNCCFNVTERATIDIEDVLYEGNEDLEVIGNIYDNPELLEEGE